MNRSLTVAIGGVVLFLCLCALCILVLVGGLAILPGNIKINSPFLTLVPGEEAATPVVIRPVRTTTPAATIQPEMTPLSTLPPLPMVPTDTLKTLEDTIVPIRDLPDLARRLEGKEDIPTTVEPRAQPWKIGDENVYWLTNSETNQNFQVTATLRFITDHLYFWVENGVSYQPAALEQLAQTFENKIYPTDREFFGSEWTPGVDDDPHLYIVYAQDLGGNVAGYFSSADEYPPEAAEYSNAHEMFMLSAVHVNLEDEFADSVLAHEFQHMIHWYRDLNEDTWLNEGFSELAALLNGYEVGGTDYVYSQDPDIQLNFWPSDNNETGPHYGASFLFVTYFLDRFGEEATQAVVKSPDNGMVSIDNVLKDINAVDPLTGRPVGADDVFLDWTISSILQDDSVGDGRYTYHNYPNAPSPDLTEEVRTCPSGPQTRDVHQYGVDYIGINCQGDYTLHFEGTMQVPVVPTDAHSGDYAFWSNRGDESDMTLTREFDFSDDSGPLTLSYWTWYDLEDEWDYLYLEASTDGENWQILTTPSGTALDPTGNSYGWGYTGESGGGPKWIQEEVDLSQFAGQKVQIRFEYVTDAAVHLEGMLLDDIAIPEIGYTSDFEADEGGWESAGWVRLSNILPQSFRLALIYTGRNPRVEYIDVGEENAVDIPLSLKDRESTILVVTSTTRFTVQPAAYRFSLMD